LLEQKNLYQSVGYWLVGKALQKSIVTRLGSLEHRPLGRRCPEEDTGNRARSYELKWNQVKLGVVETNIPMLTEALRVCEPGTSELRPKE
jgi:hypothetical protein